MATSTADSTVPPVPITSNNPIQPTDDPLYVSKNESVGSQVVTHLLTGAKHFITWRKFMEARWERCNNVIFSWIINSVSKEIGASLIHAFDCIAAWNDLKERFGGSNDSSLFSIQQEIAGLMQGDMSIAKYYGKYVILVQDARLHGVLMPER
ncbi:hypothetical protein QQ045_019903 [Rhodiola kirilowii]